MKWYFAINEDATKSPLGLHAKLAVRTARKRTNLEPHLLYLGHRNTFTEWMEAQGVVVIDVRPSYEDAIIAAANEGRYPRNFIGHWLRTEICNIETTDRIVLYTDIDVAFLRNPELADSDPSFFACAPEFREDDWGRFNSGVMLMNIPALRADYPRLCEYIRWKFKQPDGGAFTDQTVYNEFYEGRWSRLDPRLNWKPYWRVKDDAFILHFHGPKLHTILSILRGDWNWDTDFGQQIGNIFTSNKARYRGFLSLLLPILDESDDLRPVIAEILEHSTRDSRAPEAISKPPVTPLCPSCGFQPDEILARMPESYLRDSCVSWELDEASSRRLATICRERETSIGPDSSSTHRYCHFLQSAVGNWLVA